MPITKQELAELFEQLGQYKTRATELITVYIPAGQNIYTVADQLEAEKSTAKNIKSAGTRKNVGNALDKITRQLKEYKKTPENGLAIFCGNISKVEGQDDLQLWAIEPHTPLKTRMYRCDKEFILDPLREMLEVTEVFGLLVMDRREATIGMLEGKRIETLHKMTSGIPSKVRAGGQCLSPNTLVYLKVDPRYKNLKQLTPKEISDVEIGEEIKALSLTNNKIVFTKVKNKWKVNKEKYLEIVIHDRWRIFASEDHTFFKEDKGKITEVLAKNLKKGDFLVSPYGGPRIYYKGDIGFDQEIEDIKKHNKPIKMIDIETEEGNFFAEGFLVHNSSQRFHRITEGLTKEFYKRIAEDMKKIFLGMPKLKGILIGGPIPTKDEFLKGEYLTNQLQQKVMGKVDIGDASESGLGELVEKAKNLLADQERLQEKKDVEVFFRVLGEDPGKLDFKACFVYEERPDLIDLGFEVNSIAMFYDVKQDVIFTDGDRCVRFKAGSIIPAGSSYKFMPGEVAGLCRRMGFSYVDSKSFIPLPKENEDTRPIYEVILARK